MARWLLSKPKCSGLYMFKKGSGGGGGQLRSKTYFLYFQKLSITTNQIRFNKVCDKNTHP